jgi:hypothetical protein
MGETNDGYKRFRGWVAQQKVLPSCSLNFFSYDKIIYFERLMSDKLAVDVGGEKIWKYYDFGTKEESIPPLILLPGVSGTAEIFYKQFLSLCPKGYRLISVFFFGPR